MKKTITMALLLGAATSFGQSTLSLQYNDVDATISDEGTFFHDFQTSGAGYEIPKGSGANALYAFSYWMGAIDGGGILHFAGQTYSAGSDFFKGPLTIGSAQPDQTGAWLTNMFEVGRDEINAHLQNFMNPGYVPVLSIANWPAHGDTAAGFAYNLAPFVDYNSDGHYNPLDGDYPCIKGDRAVYVINNDSGTHGSGGQPLGFEIHTMFYQYASNGVEDGVTFVEVKVINRSDLDYGDFRMAFFADTDLGNSSDDYIGSDPTLNLMYAYNGDAFDEDMGGAVGYGANPPAIGVLSLDNPLSNAGGFAASSQSPSTPAQYWNHMNALDNSGAQWMDPVTGNPTSFLFSGDPENMTGTTEVGQANPPGDRRIFYTIQGGTMSPEDVKEFNFAIVMGDGGNSNTENVTVLKNRCADVNTFYAAQDECYESIYAGTDELSSLDFSIVPNPNNGVFQIEGEILQSSDITIMDVAGRVVQQELNVQQSSVNISLNETPGVYLVNITNGSKSMTKRVIIK